MSEALRASLRTALRLAAFTAGTAAVLAAVHLATREPIAAEQRRAERAALAALLPESGFDNDPVTDTTRIVAPDGLGDEQPRLVRRARLRGETARHRASAIRSKRSAAIGSTASPAARSAIRHPPDGRCGAMAATSTSSPAPPSRRARWSARFAGP